MHSGVSDNHKTDMLHSIFNSGAGPISVDEIEPNLYLGNLSAATNINTLKQLNINYILSVDSCPLPRNILELKFITNMYIQLSDLPKEDLLSHFDDTYEFISKGLEKPSSAVLVHCFFGVSRSATVIIAYLMRKYEITYAEAFEKAKAKRSIVYPNQGFVSQLGLYREMGYKVDKNYPKFKLYRLQMAADKVKKAKILPQDFFDLIKPDPGVCRIQPEPNVYQCRKCRRVVASASNLIQHASRGGEGNYCNKMYFVEPLSWMQGITQTTQGKLYCPKCTAKLGSFSWIMGCQCPCGCQVAPAFYLNPSKIDWADMVKNVEVTI